MTPFKIILINLALTFVISTCSILYNNQAIAQLVHDSSLVLYRKVWDDIDRSNTSVRAYCEARIISSNK